MSSSSSNANIIPLHIDKPGNPRSEAAMKDKLSRLPKELQQVREVSQKHLQASIQNLFDHVDDALFELADRASSNLEQNVFFESMREIRIQRRNMEKSYLYYIDRQFSRLTGDAMPMDTMPMEEAGNTGEELATDELSIVSKDELEELVAIDSLVNKALAHNKNALRVVALRLNALVNASVSEKSHPLSPRSLADSFVEASEIIKVDIKAKLVLFKLFERYVMSELANLLTKVNQAMTELGVPLPKAPGNRRMSAQKTRMGAIPGQAPAGAPTAPAASSGATAGAGGLFGTLQTLLQPQQAPQNTQSTFSDSAYANHSSDQFTVEEVSIGLLNALSQLQQTQLQQMSVHQGLQSGQPQLIPSSNIQSAIASATGNQLTVDQHSQDVIKLVDMLFSFILEDRNLSDPIKLLLSRLQIPFIKVAVADESFFKKDGHPARRLLNELATASIGWAGDANSDKPDPLLNKIESIVTKILEEFDSNFEIFTLLLTDFIAFQEKERRRAMLFEKRALDAEDGKAKAEIGRQKVAEELAELMTGKSVPDSFVSFIEGPWSNILFLIYMRQGVESQQWANGLLVAKELIWSSQPIEGEAHKNKLLALKPRLESSMGKGLQSISFNPAKQARYIEKFNQHHQNLLALFDNPPESKQSQVEEPVETQAQVSAEEQPLGLDTAKEQESTVPTSSVEEPEATYTATSTVDDVVEEKIATAAQQVVEPRVDSKQDKQATEPESEPKAEVIDKTDSVTAEVVTESVTEKATESATAEQSSVAVEQTTEEKPSIAEALQKTVEQAAKPREEKPETTPVEPAIKAVPSKPAPVVETAAEKVEAKASAQYLNLVDNFMVGVWFEKQEHADSTYRCRLAAIIRGTGKYIFVNRAGVKVAEETRETLALQLEAGILRTLDDTMLFDRALESVISNLRKSR